MDRVPTQGFCAGINWERSAPKRLLPEEGGPVLVNGSLRQKSVLPEMHTEMSQQTRQEVLARLRHFYKSAGRKHKSKLIQEAIDLLGYHRKAAIRALKGRAAWKPKLGVPALIGRPPEYA